MTRILKDQEMMSTASLLGVWFIIYHYTASARSQYITCRTNVIVQEGGRDAAKCIYLYPENGRILILLK